jgi:hypothetical protein
MWWLLAEVENHNQLWYLIPLVVSVSLVYGATRHELMMPILSNAVRAAVWILGFMGIIFVILLGVSWMV